MSFRLLVVPLFAIALFSVGCATLPYQPYAREVKKKPQHGGVIALKAEHRPEDRARADLLMKNNCGGKEVTLAEEGEVVVGEKTDSTASKTRGTAHDNSLQFGAISFGSSRPSEDTQTSSHTTQLKEWHISYHCVAGTSASPVAKKRK